MEEKNINKYQESIEGEPNSLKEKHFGEKVIIPKVEKEKVLDSLAEANVQKEISEQSAEKVGKEKESFPEIPAAPEKLVKEHKSKSFADDKALRVKKIEEIKKLSQEEQIKALCDLAVEKDIDFAAETAKGLNDAYVLDEFHDKLDKLNLVKKGKLKEI